MDNKKIIERIKKFGYVYPTNEEIIQILFGKSKTQAEKFLDSYYSENGKDIKANLLRELVRRYSYHNEVVTNPQQVVPYLKYFASKDQEHFVTVYLNGARQILDIKVINIGSTNYSLVDRLKIFREALKLKASAIIIAHNHPSGAESPSDEDNEAYEQLQKAGEIVGIQVLDSIIVTEKGYYSYSENK